MAATGADTAPPAVYRPSWRYRRRVIFCSLWHCLAALWFMLLSAAGLSYAGMFNTWLSTFYDIAFIAVIGFVAMMVGSYVWGAAWDDKNFMAMLGRLGGRGDSFDSYGGGYADVGDQEGEVRL